MAARLLGLCVRISPGAWMSVVSVVCCQVEVSVWAYHSSRGVLPSVVCPMSVIAKPRKRRPCPGIGSKRHKKMRRNKNIFQNALLRIGS